MTDTHSLTSRDERRAAGKRLRERTTEIAESTKIHRIAR